MALTKVSGNEIDNTSTLSTQSISVSGVSTVGSLSIGATSVISSARQLQNIASLDATTTATIESAIANAPNTFTDLKITGISTLGVTSATNFIAQSLSVSGISTLGVTSVTNLTAQQLNISGIVTATTFVGALTGTATSTTNIPNLTGAITSSNTTTSLGSFTSANLLTALTDETGSGAAVFATSPTLVTPVLGAASATSIVVSSGSTFTNGPVLVGTGTSTGTASQPLQVTGGAYVSGSVGIGTTNPSASYKFDVVGNGRFSQDIVVNSVIIGCGGISTETVVVGAGAGTSGPGSQNVFVGAGAGKSATSAAYRNTVIGFQAMYSNDIGPTNTAIGFQALYSLCGYTYYNTAVGRYALGSLTSGVGNIAMGHNSGASVTTGASNICIGSGGPTTGSSNIMIAGAGSTAGSSNILIGGNITASTGTESYNVILGTITVAGGINNNIILGDGQGNERLRINSSGNVGIGTTNPQGSLDVHADQNTSTILYVRNPNSGSSARTRIIASSDSGAGSIAMGQHSSNYAGASNQGWLWTSGASTPLVLGTVGTERVRVTTGGNVGIATTNPQYTLHVVGSFAATTKSFVIDHPTKPNYKLRYASLEGAENGVYVRGRTTENIIELPEYWTELVDNDSITVNLTPIGNKHIWIEEINNNKVYIDSDSSIDCFYTVFAERKDVEKLVVEIEGN